MRTVKRSGISIYNLSIRHKKYIIRKIILRNKSGKRKTYSTEKRNSWANNQQHSKRNVCACVFMEVVWHFLIWNSTHQHPTHTVNLCCVPHFVDLPTKERISQPYMAVSRCNIHIQGRRCAITHRIRSWAKCAACMSCICERERSILASHFALNTYIYIIRAYLCVFTREVPYRSATNTQYRICVITYIIEP